ncbi:MAG TPA: hypothetical protein VHM26_18620 [Chitinophagaceae bacterium]|jgi:hypothetical protein|nr:hypothetical protein [Chitinophagaceae bacterium]
MRKLQKPLAILLFALLTVISCRRDSLPDKQNSPNEEDKTSTASKEVIFKLTPAEIATIKNEWLKKVRSKPRDPGIAAKGGCGEHVSHQILIVEATSSSCSATSWDIKYIIWSYDLVGSNYVQNPISVSFTDVNSNPLSSTLLNSQPTNYSGCPDWMFDGYCELTREYTYLLSNVPAPASAWPTDLGDFTLDLRSGFSGLCTPLTVSGDLKGSFTAADYASMPARINANPTGGTSLLVATDCSQTCPPHYIVCPTGGTFTYWPQGSPGSPTNQSLSAIGALITSIPSGTYDYSCTLNYTIGGNPYTSLPKTGTFIIP